MSSRLGLHNCFSCLSSIAAESADFSQDFCLHTLHHVPCLTFSLHSSCTVSLHIPSNIPCYPSQDFFFDRKTADQAASLTCLLRPSFPGLLLLADTRVLAQPKLAHVIAVLSGLSLSRSSPLQLHCLLRFPTKSLASPCTAPLSHVRLPNPGCFLET